MKDDGAWRVLYGFPYVCQFLTITLFTFVFPEESVSFNIARGNDEEALSLIRKVYSPNEDPEEILQTLKSKTSKGASRVWGAIWGHFWAQIVFFCFFVSQFLCLFLASLLGVPRSQF